MVIASVTINRFGQSEAGNDLIQILVWFVNQRVDHKLSVSRSVLCPLNQYLTVRLLTFLLLDLDVCTRYFTDSVNVAPTTTDYPRNGC